MDMEEKANAQTESARLKKKRKLPVWLPIGIVAVLIIAVVAGVTVYSNAPAQRASKQISLGERYLTENNYEEAIVAFKAAIEIDPANEEAKKGLADAYLAWGNSVLETEDRERAMEIYGEGYALTSDERISGQISSIEETIRQEEAERLAKEEQKRLEEEKKKAEEEARLKAEEEEKRKAQEEAKKKAEEEEKKKQEEEARLKAEEEKKAEEARKKAAEEQAAQAQEAGASAPVGSDAEALKAYAISLGYDVTPTDYGYECQYPAGNGNTYYAYALVVFDTVGDGSVVAEVSDFWNYMDFNNPVIGIQGQRTYSGLESSKKLLEDSKAFYINKVNGGNPILIPVE